MIFDKTYPSSLKSRGIRGYKEMLSFFHLEFRIKIFHIGQKSEFTANGAYREWIESQEGFSSSSRHGNSDIATIMSPSGQSV
mmetsp:Transcript_11767/g.21839  ORF Transcript_11767/g.21839 Transcript_11767/m.21839 type:complete len:82 (-) Transcript_11767:267-512(-)